MIVNFSEKLGESFPRKNEIKIIIREIQREIKLKEEERFPKYLTFVPKNIIIPFGRYDRFEDKLEIFIPRILLSKNYWNKKEWRCVIKHILTHEVVEPIERKDISSGLKLWLNKCYFTLMPFESQRLDLEADEYSLEAFSEDTCEDISTDRRCLYSGEQEYGFSLIHKEILEVEKHYLNNLKIEMRDNSYYSNIQPYKLTCWLLSGMRKAVLNKEMKNHRLGRFESNILIHTIGKKIIYPELKKPLYLIFKELRNKKPSYKIVLKHSLDFVKKLKCNKDLN